MRHMIPFTFGPSCQIYSGLFRGHSLKHVTCVRLRRRTSTLRLQPPSQAPTLSQTLPLSPHQLSLPIQTTTPVRCLAHLHNPTSPLHTPRPHRHQHQTKPTPESHVSRSRLNTSHYPSRITTPRSVQSASRSMASRGKGSTPPPPSSLPSSRSSSPPTATTTTTATTATATAKTTTTTSNTNNNNTNNRTEESPPSFLSRKKKEIVDRSMALFQAGFDRCLDKSVSGSSSSFAASAAAAAAAAGGAGLAAAAAAAGRRRVKRVREEDGEDCEDGCGGKGEGKGGGGGGVKGAVVKKKRGNPAVEKGERKKGGEGGKKFACPFCRHDPGRYRNVKTCCGPGWDDVHRVK